jgi:hypothetical protein
MNSIVSLDYFKPLLLLSLLFIDHVLDRFLFFSFGECGELICPIFVFIRNVHRTVLSVSTNISIGTLIWHQKCHVLFVKFTLYEIHRVEIIFSHHTIIKINLILKFKIVSKNLYPWRSLYCKDSTLFQFIGLFLVGLEEIS